MCTRSNARVDYYYKKEMAIIFVCQVTNFSVWKTGAHMGRGVIQSQTSCSFIEDGWPSLVFHTLHCDWTEKERIECVEDWSTSGEGRNSSQTSCSFIEDMSKSGKPYIALWLNKKRKDGMCGWLGSVKQRKRLPGILPLSIIDLKPSPRTNTKSMRSWVNRKDGS